ncbi:MAG TPA: glycoside hydrolase family 99-like domain-containing protein [Sphingobium sp.]|uniref:glycoside hydrolase family 99-like domain-containing protein n=1 Tax=Sphingobium sp. TaxID=1912891 RepID=UPI002ED4626F
MRRFLSRALCALTALLSATAVHAAAPEVGTYYFPGWHPDPLTGNKDNWIPIRAFPDREPQRGWYNDSDPQVLQSQADEMKAAGINFVVFDWYFEKGGVRAAAPLDNYLKLPEGVPHASILWARHGSSPPNTTAEWQDVIKLWVGYAKSPNFYRIDGQPVVMVFDTGRMVREATQAGSDIGSWVAMAQDAAHKAGLPPFYFVAGVWNGQDPTIAIAAKAGFKSITSYNYSRAPGDARAAHGYAERDDAYRRVWIRMIDNRSGLPAILPLTAGWDRRAWGGSEDKLADTSEPSGDQFRDHLTAARSFMTEKGVSRAVICCWNEYGEGSVIEPTKALGDAKLKAIHDILKQN